MRRLVVLPFVLAGCVTDLPSTEGVMTEAALRQERPVLVALDPLLAEAARPSRAAEAQTPLAGRGAALRTARIPATGAGDLDARGAVLRDRAARLRNTEL